MNSAPKEAGIRVGHFRQVLGAALICWSGACFTAVLGPVVTPAGAQDQYSDDDCARIFDSAGTPNAFSYDPRAPLPGFDAKQAIYTCMNSVKRFPEERIFRVALANAYWFASEREAAVRVLAHAATRFGGVYRSALDDVSGLDRNDDALEILKTLAKTEADAQAVLAHFYHEGLGVTEDRDLAASLFRRSAEQGNPEGQFQVGWALWSAAESDPDNAMANEWRSEAEPWLRKAAAQCHLEAQETIDETYDKVDENQKLRNETLIKARRGDVIAQGRLGREYLSEMFGPQSDLDAYAWLSIALERGSQESESLEYWRHVLTGRMSSSQVAAAKALTAYKTFSLCGLNVAGLAAGPA